MPVCFGVFFAVAWHGVRQPLRQHRISQSDRYATAAMTSANQLLECDMAVVGGGPAGYAMAALLSSKHEHSVVLVDPTPDAPWPNNYGEWRAEWQELSKRLEMPELLSQCVRREWHVTDCFFGGSWGMPTSQRTRLQREYLQVDRLALKDVLRAKMASSGKCTVVAARLNARTIAPNIFDANLVHDASGSTLTLSSGQMIRAKIVVDASGFESQLVRREGLLEAAMWAELPPGFQIAYGFTVDVAAGGHAPYDAEAMTLFDYRTDHITEPDWLADVISRPSFMYVMPYGKLPGGRWRAFFEETSLVGRGERRLEFEELKRRAFRRLEHLGIEILPETVDDEEFCYIPMGGSLPDLSQRVVAVGGAAATVHPSTGYQLCRMLASSTELASSLANELQRPDFEPDAAAAAAYRTLWPYKHRLQRDFQVFGGEFLSLQPVDRLRGFFDAFFQLDQNVWGGFLAGWPGLPGNDNHDEYYKRLRFGISLFFRFPPQVALAMMFYAVQFSVEFGPSLLRSFAEPLFGNPAPAVDLRDARRRLEDVYVQGDMEAKREALRMLRDSSGVREGSLPSPQVAMLDNEVDGAAYR
mmetsp:Transcript_52629/g.87406  ORF Transcript_52629/g.87406 Transcript_52629/m.87406 type:complete len:584 (+) Transcript_52629:129-1880(+)